MQGQILWSGFKTKQLMYRRRKRSRGRSRWTLGRKITLVLDSILAYSYFPIRLMSGIGFIVASLGFLYALLIFIGFFIHGNPVQGWTPLMIIILVVGGLQMMMLGIIGEYLWRTLSEVRKRDNFVVEAIFSSAPSAEE